jgi:hypothetical protein
MGAAALSARRHAYNTRLLPITHPYCMLRRHGAIGMGAAALGARRHAPSGPRRVPRSPAPRPSRPAGPLQRAPRRHLGSAPPRCTRHPYGTAVRPSRTTRAVRTSSASRCGSLAAAMLAMSSRSGSSRRARPCAATTSARGLSSGSTRRSTTCARATRELVAAHEVQGLAGGAPPPPQSPGGARAGSPCVSVPTVRGRAASQHARQITPLAVITEQPSLNWRDSRGDRPAACRSSIRESAAVVWYALNSLELSTIMACSCV